MEALRWGGVSYDRDIPVSWCNIEGAAFFSFASSPFIKLLYMGTSLIKKRTTKGP